MKRRELIRSAVLGCAGLACPIALSRAMESVHAPDGQIQVFSACTDRQGRHYIAASDLSGNFIFKIEIPHRAHDMLIAEDRQRAVYFARRPGTQMHIVDLQSGQLVKTLDSRSGYHFFGHGAFSHDGRFLFVTENAYLEKRGVIGVYDVRDDFRRVQSFDSAGIGPHQLALLNRSNTLVVANGGILTTPETGREKLNLDTMQPSLNYIDISNGKLLAQYQPPHHHMSVRHLAVSAFDQVLVGIQFQGDAKALFPLVMSHQGETALQAMANDDENWLGMHQYIASVVVDDTGALGLTTSPRGNCVSLWSLPERRFIASASVRDVAGAAFDHEHRRFILSNGIGELLSLRLRGGSLDLAVLSRHPGVRWDNHLKLLV